MTGFASHMTSIGFLDIYVEEPSTVSGDDGNVQNSSDPLVGHYSNMREFFQASQLVGKQELKRSNKGRDAVLDPTVSSYIYMYSVYTCIHIMYMYIYRCIAVSLRLNLYVYFVLVSCT